MNPVERLLRRWGILSAGPEPETPEIERALEARLQRLRALDPETRRQWPLVRAQLTRERAVRPGAAVRLRVLRPALAFGLVAAAVLLAVVLPDSSLSPTAHETGRGQHTTILLADSTEVTLNHTSRLTVGEASSGEGRLVRLEGEAFFRVRKSATPFVVATDLGTVRVLGTAFNVRNRDDRLEVAVVTGSVRVTSVSVEEVVVLEAGELTRCTRGNGPEEPAPLLYGEYPGWLHGKLFFDRATLSEACREVGDYFDVEVIIELPSGDERTITGALDARTPELAIATLARLTGRRYRHDPSGFTLY